MPIKDQAYTVNFLVEDLGSTSADGVTGENATTLTALRLIQDGNLSAPSLTTLTEISATGAPGWYSLDISTGSNDGNFMGIIGASTTTDARIKPLLWENDDDPENIYYADINLDRDTTGSTNDEYLVVWYKYGTVQTSEPSSPTIGVKNFAGTTLVTPGTAMSEIPTNTGEYYFSADGTAGKLKMTPGAGIIITVQATIDSATRTWKRVIGRDS